ncbi:hypothetical protein BS50DRAFT_588919 [Corynespora cassiicola Philippines]|uniref:Uncharacterized protein n=1 Tax=Corynespora cassiicola Philippines TaxID=1448308 RepID=A0A2T2NM89_CORCC|nr:hypothetical protein BS50DRAFT_588919 [Corynespora cassiicola Philippines]
MCLPNGDNTRYGVISGVLSCGPGITSASIASGYLPHSAPYNLTELLRCRAPIFSISATTSKPTTSFSSRGNSSTTKYRVIDQQVDLIAHCLSTYTYSTDDLQFSTGLQLNFLRHLYAGANHTAFFLLPVPTYAYSPPFGDGLGPSSSGNPEPWRSGCLELLPETLHCPGERYLVMYT